MTLEAGTLLQRLRNKYGFTQERFGTIIGYNPKYLSRVENNKELISQKLFEEIEKSGVFSFDDLQLLAELAAIDTSFEYYGVDISSHLNAPIDFVEDLLKKVKAERLQGDTTHLKLLFCIIDMFKGFLSQYPNDKKRVDQAIARATMERMFSYIIRGDEAEIRGGLGDDLSLLRSVEYALVDPEDIETAHIIQYKVPYACGDMEAFETGMRPFISRLTVPIVKLYALKDLVVSSAMRYKRKNLGREPATNQFLDHEEQLLELMKDAPVSTDISARCYISVSCSRFHLGLPKSDYYFQLAKREAKRSLIDESYTALSEASIIRTRVDQLTHSQDYDAEVIIEYAHKNLLKLRPFKRKFNHSLKWLINHKDNQVSKYGSYMNDIIAQLAI